MATVKRHTFSKEEIKDLENIVQKAHSEVSKAQCAIGHFKRAKINAQQKHTSKNHNYRYIINVQHICKRK